MQEGYLFVIVACGYSMEAPMISSEISIKGLNTGYIFKSLYQDVYSQTDLKERICERLDTADSSNLKISKSDL